MEREELIKVLRWCGDKNSEWCVNETYKCPLWNECRITDDCKAELMTMAADALEAAERKGDGKDGSDEITKAWDRNIERKKVAEKIAVEEELNRRRRELEELKRELEELKKKTKDDKMREDREDDPLRPMWPNWD